MRRVKQGDPTGCGLACIAMLAGTDYSSVRELAVKQLGFDDSATFYTGTKDLKDLGKNFSIELGKKRRQFKSFQELPEMANIGHKLQGRLGHMALGRLSKDIK